MSEPCYQIGAQGHRGSKAVQRLIELAPASGALALWMRHRDVEAVDAQSLSGNAGTRAGTSAVAGTTHGSRTQTGKHPANVRGTLLYFDGPIANDGKHIFYGPAFEHLTIRRQMGLLAHQILHVALRHAPRQQALAGAQGQVDAELFNVCADAIVNSALAHLDWLELPPRAIQLDTLLQRVLGIHEPLPRSLQRWDTEALYRAIDDRERPRGGAGSRSRDEGAGSHDQTDTGNRATQPMSDGPLTELARAMLDPQLRDLLPADATPVDAGAEQQSAEDSRRWSERLSRVQAADGEQSILRELLADRPRQRVPWQQVLRTRLSRSLAPVPELSWSRPSRSYLANRGRTAGGRRLPWEPGITGNRAVPRLVVVMDVSGSVANPLLDRFATEIDRLMKLHRASVWLVIGDDHVRSEVQLKPGCQEVRGIRFHGGGGTDLTPLLAAADRYKPDIVVCLTDLQGPIAFVPTWPVVWAVPPAFAATQVLFGTVLTLG